MCKVWDEWYHEKLKYYKEMTGCEWQDVWTAEEDVINFYGDSDPIKTTFRTGRLLITQSKLQKVSNENDIQLWPKKWEDKDYFMNVIKPIHEKEREYK